MKTKGLIVSLLALLLLWPVTAAFADGPVVRFDDGQIFVDEDVSLGPGDTIDGDLGVFDGDLDMASGSTVHGSVFVANGDAHIAGRVNGDVVVIEGDLELAESGQVDGDVFGMSGDQEIAGRVNGDLAVLFGDVELRSSAEIDGDVLAAPGTVDRAAGARVGGDMVQDIPFPPLPFLERWSEDVPGLNVPPMPELPEIPNVPEELPKLSQPMPPPQPTALHQIGRFVGRVVGALFMSLLAIVVGMLIVFIWPHTTRRVSNCISAMPVQSVGLGLLTFVIAAALEVLAVVLMITIILVGAVLIGTVILIPIGLFLILVSVLLLLPVPVALAGGMILGWVAMAEMIGRRVFKALRIDNPTPLSAALVGLVITVPLAAILWFVMPLCCGWPFVLLLTSVGLGAVFHTRFGTQDCQPAGPAALPLEAMDDEAGRPDGP